MVEEIKRTKDIFLTHMERMIDTRGIEHSDVKMMGELADIVKDLSQAERDCWEAEYYKTVTESMQGKGELSGYTQVGGSRGSSANGGRMGYGGGRMGYMQNDKMGHSDPISAIRDMLATSNPEMRAQIHNELADIMGMR